MNEGIMSYSRFLHRAGAVAAAALLTIALGLKPASAIGTDTPSTSSDTKKEKTDKQKSDKKKKNDNSGALTDERKKLADAEFLRGYRAAREMILAGQYEAGINAMHALGRDGNPDVANYIGYAYRRLGDFADSKVWYEKALAVDPQHVRTWSYYGMWHAEQGNRLKAEDFLHKIKLLCGNTSCKEYTELKAVIDGTGSY
jgi:tetratricopeptide (TPR) repeat protein